MTLCPGMLTDHVSGTIESLKIILKIFSLIFIWMIYLSFIKYVNCLLQENPKNHAWFVKRARKQSTMKVFLKINYFVRISWLWIQIHVLLWYSWTPHWATVPINKNACVIVLLHWFENKKYKQPSPNCSKFWNFRYISL